MFRNIIIVYKFVNQCIDINIVKMQIKSFSFVVEKYKYELLKYENNLIKKIMYKKFYMKLNMYYSYN